MLYIRPFQVLANLAENASLKLLFGCYFGYNEGRLKLVRF
jgi:hypothetical protein